MVDAPQTTPRWDVIENAVARLAEDRTERALTSLSSMVTGTTTATGEVLTPAKAHAMFREWGRLLREHRRREVVLEVVAGYAGPPLRTDHPTEGAVIEGAYCFQS